MLNYFLDLTEDILNETIGLVQSDKNFVYDEVSYALKQTQSHINSTRVNGQDTSSPVLSNIWQRASKRIGKIKRRRIQELARAIEEKSKYWADPDNYDSEKLDKFKMRITQVQETLKILCN